MHSTYRRRELPERLTHYLYDTSHTIPGFSSSYTTALTNMCGFPREALAREELELEVVREYTARVQRIVEGCSQVLTCGPCSR